MSENVHLQSGIEGLVWPAVHVGRAAELMALQRQFDESQWWSPEQVRAAQFRQVSVLLDHAAKMVPFHRIRLHEAGFRPGKPLTEEVWQQVPVLTTTAWLTPSHQVN